MRRMCGCGKRCGGWGRGFRVACVCGINGFCRDKEGRARKGQRLELVMQLGSERAGQECARVWLFE
jgi:hypothetical protein